MSSSARFNFLKRESSLFYFEYILAIAHFFGFSTIVLNAYFFNTYNNGLAWPAKNDSSGRGTQFHGFLMVLAFVYFQGEALLAYRVYRYNAKLISKLIHTALHIVAIGIGITALVAIILEKNLNKHKHFYTVHSWIGVCLLAVYLVQFSFGFFTYLCPCAPNSNRARLMPVHKAVGVGCFLVGTIQCVIGYVQYLSWTSPSCFSTLSCANRLEYVASFAILTSVIYALLVLAVIVPSSWKRFKTPEELR